MLRFFRKTQTSKQVNQRAALLFISMVFVVSAIASAFMPAATYAATINSKTSLSDQVYTLSVYNGMLDCLTQDGQQRDNSGFLFTQIRTSEANLKSGDWWREGGSVYWGTSQGAESQISFLNPNTQKANGNLICNEIVKVAAPLFGYDSIFSFACSFIEKRADGSSCKTGADENFRELSPYINNFKSVIGKKVWGETGPQLTYDKADNNAGLYILYREAFLAGCEPKKSSSPSAEFAYKNIQIINDDRSDSTQTYEGKPRTDVRVVYRPNDNAVRTSCADISNKVNEYAVAYKAYLNTHKDDVGSGANEKCNDPAYKVNNEEECANAVPASSTCAIDDIGWLLCPILTAGAQLADGAYGFLQEDFLKTDTSLINTDPTAKTNTDNTGESKLIGTGTYTAWKVMQSIGNVAFIIAVLVIIFSQLTSVGVSNYGVKKLLPRIIVAAMLVNLSFFLSQIAVDVSNILGYSVKEIFEGIADQVKASGTGTVGPGEDQSGNLVGITATVLATAGFAWINIGAVIVAIVGALVALLTIFALLIVRKVLIVLLIVVAPLAFVAYLLPNTEPLFKKWWKMLSTLLLLFPIIGLVYGACLLASAILLQVAGDDKVLQIAAYMALVLPLIAVIPLLKGSLDGVGKLGGAIQKFGSSQGGKLGNAAGKGFENSRVGQFKQFRQNERSLRRAQIQSGTYQGKNKIRSAISNVNKKINESKVTGKFGDRALATGAALTDKENDELLKNAGSRIDNTTYTDSATGQQLPVSQAQMMQIATGQDMTDSTGAVVARASSFDTHTRMAAIQRAAKIATVKDAHSLVDASTSMSTAERKTLSGGLASSAVLTKAQYLGGKTLGDIEQGTASTRTAALSALKDGKITAETLAASNVDSAHELLEAAMSKGEGSPERLALKSAYDELNKPDSRLREKIVTGGDHDKALSGIRSL